MPRPRKKRSRRRLEIEADVAVLRLEGLPAPIDLRRRPTFRRVLQALLEQPHGVPCSTQTLVSAGWPGEMILPEAARNRLHVLIATLRRLGLGSDLLTLEGGYALSPELEIVYLEASTEDPLLDTDPELPRGDLSSPVGSLPADTSSFVGRHAELQALDALLCPKHDGDDRPRIIGLSGLGGVGKSRLALEAARRGSRSFSGGAHYFELHHCLDVQDICLAMARTLGLLVQVRVEISALTRSLAERGRMLFLFDNCEGARYAVAELVLLLCRELPELLIVTTSRVPLGIPGEHRIVVGLLPELEARDLFHSRARVSEASFDGTADPATEQLLEALAGHPLALEIAAERVVHLSPTEVLRGLELGRSGPGSSGPLDAALRWSWSALDDADRAALASLSFFRGGFTLEAAEAVVPLPSRAPWIGEVLHRLCARGLVDIGASFDDPSTHRYRLLDAVAEFAATRLTENQPLFEHLQRAHLGHFAALGDSDHLGSLFGTTSPATYAALVQEQGNLHLALETGVLLGEPESATRAALALAHLYRSIGPFDRACQILRASLCVAGCPPHTEALALILLAGLLSWKSDHETHSAIASARKAARKTGLPTLTGGIDLTEAIARFDHGETSEGYRLARRAERTARKHALPHLEAAALNLLCIITRQRGEYDAAIRHGERGIACADACGDRRRRAILLHNLGGAELCAGRLEAAEALYEEALAGYATVHERQALPHTLGNLALIALLRGKLETARSHYDRAKTLHQDLGHHRGVVSAIGGLGEVELVAGNFERAQHFLEEAVEGAHRAGLLREFGAFSSALGEALARAGDLAKARRSFDRARRALKQVDEASELAILEARRGLVDQTMRGRPDLAKRRLARARKAREFLGEAERSELGHAIARLEAALALPPPVGRA